MVGALRGTPGEVHCAPDLRGRFLVGSLRDFRGDRLLDTMEQARSKYGDVAKFRVGARRAHPISHPGLTQEVLAKEEALLKIQEGTDRKIGLGLETTEPERSRH